MKLKNTKKKFLIVFSAVVIAGCAVTPKPLSKATIGKAIELDKGRMYADQVPVEEALSLGDVMARAMRYNQDYRTQRMNEALAHGQFEIAKYDMLPSLAAEAGYLSRSNVSASRSVSIFTGNETVAPSSSQDRNREIADLRFSWNILDFGVSYFQAKQEADRFLISDSNRKKVALSLMQQALVAYWNALAAQKLEQPVEQALSDARAALADISRGLEAKIYRKPLEALTLKRQLLESINQLETLQQSMQSAKIVLAHLINLPKNEDLVLKEFNAASEFDINSVTEDVLEMTALSNSSDLAEQIYNVRIEKLETRKAIMRLLPGIEFGYGSSYDSNSFLHNNHWGEASLRVSWNLLKLASTQQTLENADLREAAAEQRRLAVSMAVITQLNLALQQMGNTVRQQDRARELKEIDDQISRYTSGSTAGSTSIVEKVQSQVSALGTHMAYLKSISESQEAKGALFLALGLSPIPEQHNLMTLPHLAHEIEQRLIAWHNGDIPFYTKDDVSEETQENGTE